MLVATCLAAVAFGGPAAAVPYPAEPPPATVSDATVGAGGTVTFTASGFIAGETVQITVAYVGGASQGMALVAARQDVVGSETADGNGSIAVPVTLTTPGTATITATGLTSGVTVSTTVTVLGGGEQAGLPVTGASLRDALLAGTALVLVGAWLVAWMLRRRRAAAADPAGAPAEPGVRPAAPVG